MPKVTAARIAAIKANFETGDTFTETTLSDFIDALAEAAEAHTHTADGGDGSGTGDASALYARGAAVFSVPGDIEVSDDAAPSVCLTVDSTLVEIYAYVRTAPTGQGLRFDIKRNGTSLLDTPAYIEIAAGENTASRTTSFVSTSLSEDDRIDIDIDQVGSGDAGADLSVFVRVRQAVQDS